MSRHLARVLTLAALTTAVGALHAQQPNAAAPAGPALSIDQVIGMAVKKNFDLQIQDFSTEVAKQNVEVAKGSFDPTLNASLSRNLSQAASTINTLDGTTGVGQRNDGTSASVGISELLAQTGGTLGLSTSTNRSATNSRFSTLNPAFGNNVTATLSQPLLKNAGPTVTKANLERTKISLTIAQLTYRSRVLTTIRGTEAAYYNLVSARETLHVRQLSLDLAQQLFDENKTRKETGVATDLDVLTAEVGVANARRAVIQAEQSVHDREDALLNLLGPANFSQRPGAVNFEVTTDKSPVFDFSYKLARDNSPDFRTAAETIRQLEIDLATARRNKLPTLNLNGSLGYSNTDDSYGDVYSNLRDRHGNNWSLGLSYSMPWGRRADKARASIAETNVTQQKIRVDQLDQTIVVNVRTAVRAVETNIASVEIAAKATELSQKQYELQKARFDAGLSTSRLVLQAQDDLETARLSELTAKVALRSAVADLRQLEGSSLDRYRVVLP